MSSTLSSSHQDNAGVQPSSAVRKIVIAVGVMVELWALLIVMFAIMYSVFAQPK